MSDEISEATIDSASVQSDAPTLQVPAHRSAARTSAARAAFREMLAKSKDTDVAHDDDGDPVQVAPEPAKPTEAVGDDELERLREQLAAERERRSYESTEPEQRGPDLEAYIDAPHRSYRSWLESMRGEALSDEDFKSEAVDFITAISTEVLGVPLPPNVKAKFDAAQARKMIRTSKTTAAKREAMAREKSEAAAVEREWAKAATTLDRHFKPGSEAARTYPWLAAEDSPGQLITDTIREAGSQGTTLTWEEASKKIDSHLAEQAKRREARRKPLPATAPTEKAPAAPSTPGRWSRAAHLRQSLEAFKKATQK